MTSINFFRFVCDESPLIVASSGRDKLDVWNERLIQLMSVTRNGRSLRLTIFSRFFIICPSCVTKYLNPSPGNEREEVKSELIDDYIGDTLPAGDRRRFELYFLTQSDWEGIEQALPLW